MLALLLLAAAAFPQEIREHDWRLFHVPEDGSLGLYVDTASIEAKGTRRTAWIKEDRLAVDEHGLIRRVDRTQVDCRAKTARLLASYQYGAGGELSDSFELPEQEQKDVAVRAGSTTEAALRHLCAMEP